MQWNIEVANATATVSVSTSGTVPALATALVSWSPSQPVLIPTEQARYCRGKLEALRAAASVIGVYPILVEPSPVRWLPRAERTHVKG